MLLVDCECCGVIWELLGLQLSVLKFILFEIKHQNLAPKITTKCFRKHLK